MRRVRTHFRKLFVLELENRYTPAISVSLSGGTVSFIGDGSNEPMGLIVNANGYLEHAIPFVNGFLASSEDLDSSLAGVQSARPIDLTAMVFNLGDGSDAVSIQNVPVPATITNTENIRIVLSGNGNATLTNSNAALAFAGGSSKNYSLGTPTVVTVEGYQGPTGGDNIFDCSAVTNYNLYLRGYDGNDTLRGGALPDRLEGGIGNDVLEGFGGDENGYYANLGVYAGLYGEQGNDALRGGEGNDYLEDIGPMGSADGGNGTDFYYATEAASALITDTSFSMGGATSIGFADGYRIVGDANNNVLDASGLLISGTVWLDGGDGNDTLLGSAYPDRLEGGNGDDTVSGNGGQDGFTYNFVFGNFCGIYGNAGTDTLYGGAGNDYLEDTGPGGAADGGADFDNYVFLGASSATLTDTTLSVGGVASVGNGMEGIRIDGDDNANVLTAATVTAYPVWFRGQGGNDIITGGKLADVLEGGNDDDTINGGDGDENRAYNAILGSYEGIYGGYGNDKLYGGNGNDYIEDYGPLGAADGGSGTDYYLMYDAASALLTDTTLSIGGASSIGNSFEIVRIDGDFNDNILNASAVTQYPVWFRGNSGNDTITGGKLADVLEGGNDDDTIDGGLGDENHTYNALINSYVGIYGGYGNDKLYGGGGDDYVEDYGPMGAADGGTGTDYYLMYQAASALLTDSTLSIGGAASIGNGFEIVRIDGDESDNVLNASSVTAFPVWLRGQGGNDTLTGGSKADVLEGGEGDDTLNAGEGNQDHSYDPILNNYVGIYGGNGKDTLSAGSGNDYFDDVGPDGSISGGGGSDNAYVQGVASTTITNTSFNYGTGTGSTGAVEFIAIEGTPFVDILDASAFTLGSVQFRGGAGSDILKGGSGPDHLEGGDGDDLLEGNGGNDSGFIAGLNAFGLLAGDGGNDTVRGGAGDDYLYGGNENDTLEGGDGDDYTEAGNGDDIIRDGPGANTIYGQAGSDQMVMLGTTGPDLLTVDVGNFSINGKQTNYYDVETLTGDTLAGVDEGTQVNAPGLSPYTIANLEPTVFAGPDVANTDIPFVFVRTATFKDIGAGQTWTGTADYAEGGGFVPITVDSKNMTFSLDHAYSSGGVFNVRVRITDNQGNTGEDSFQLIRPAGIQVGIAGGAQRSMIGQLTISFADERFFSGNWFTFQRLSPGLLPTVTPTILSAPGSPTTVRLNFSGPGLDPGGYSLQDGDWKLTLNSALILNGANQPFDGNADNVPGGDFLFPFHRLFGDVNGDRTVEGVIDFPAFGAAFNIAAVGSPFDYDGNGIVEGVVDFPAFGAHFNVTL